MLFILNFTFTNFSDCLKTAHTRFDFKKAHNNVIYSLQLKSCVRNGWAELDYRSSSSSLRQHREQSTRHTVNSSRDEFSFSRNSDVITVNSSHAEITYKVASGAQNGNR